MIFRLKTSKRTQEIFQELENRTNYKPYTIGKTCYCMVPEGKYFGS